MPAVSKSQRRFMGMVHAYQQGKLDTSSIPKDVLDRIKAAAESMSKRASKDFAKSKEKGLPQHVREYFGDQVLEESDMLRRFMKMVMQYQQGTLDTRGMTPLLIKQIKRASDNMEKDARKFASQEQVSESKVQMHISGPRGARVVSIHNKKTKKQLATNFKSENEAKEYAKKKNWSVSPVTIVESNALTFKEFLIAESDHYTWQPSYDHIGTHYSSGKTTQLAKGVLKQLEQYGRKGLPKVYKDVQEYLGDMYAEFPWSPEASIKAMRQVLKSPKFAEINKLWKKNHKFDMGKELRAGIAAAKEELE